MSFKQVFYSGVVLVVAVSLFGSTASLATALTREERAAQWAEERAAREAALEARRAEREAQRAAREAQRAEESNGPSDTTPVDGTPCSCSAQLSFARPDLQWRGSGLAFIPRVDVSLRTRGETTDNDWSARLVYGGEAAFTSTDVSVPQPVSFAGTRVIQEGQCGSNRYSFTGLAIDEIPLTGLLRSLVGLDQELKGALKMSAHIEGCGFDEERRQFGFVVEELGNLSIGGWRSVR